MLWTDGDVVTDTDLYSLDAELPDVATTEGIVLNGDNGLIRRAKSDAQAVLSRFLSFSGLSATDLTLRDINMPIGIPELRYNYAGLEQIVTSGESEGSWSALKNWLANRTLLRVYRAATNKNKDRYSDRYDALAELVKGDYWPQFKRRGMPIIFNPLSAPGALGMRVGFFTSANLSLTADIAGTSTASFDYAITWVGSKYVSATDKRNGESFRSARVTLTMTAGHLATISIVGLVPPNGTQPQFTQSSSRYSPGVAVGWNVWAGTVGGTMYRQNATVLLLSNLSFTLPGNPVLSGEQLDFGQHEDIILEMRTELLRV